MMSVGMLTVYGDPNAGFLAPGGGINVFVLNLTRALTARGAQARLLSPWYANRPTIEQHVPTELLDLGLEHMSKSMILDRIDEMVVRSEAYIPDLRSFHVVHSHYWLSGLYWYRLLECFPELSGVTWLHSFHSLARIRERHVEDTVLSRRVEAEETILERAQCILVNSPREADDLYSLYTNRPQRCEELAGGYISEQFVPGRGYFLHQFLGLDLRQRIVLFVGRFEERKGVFVFLRVAEAMRDDSRLTFVMVGGREDFSYEQQLLARARQWTEERQLENVRFVAPVPHAKLHLIYQSGAYILLPSTYEPFGMTALEAQGCECVPIASNVGGLSHTVAHEETGYLTDNSVGAYVERLRYLERNRRCYEALRQRASSRVRSNFSWTKLAELYMELLEEITGGSP